MFDIHLYKNNIHICSIEKEDLLSIQQWINIQNYNNNLEKPLFLNEFYEKFLEYYVSENEFFLKIIEENKLIGILKGRIEFKNTNEVWLWYFLLDEDYREKGLGSIIINSVIKYFNHELGIDYIYSCVCKKNVRVLKFWKQNNFKLFRISKGFFNISGEEMDMLILKYNSDKPVFI